MRNILLALFILWCGVANAATYFVSASGSGNGLSASTPDSQADYEAGNAPFNALTTNDTVYFIGEFTTTLDCNETGYHAMRGDYPNYPASFATGSDISIYCDTDGKTVRGFPVSGTDDTAIMYLEGDDIVVEYNRVWDYGVSGQNHDGIFVGNGARGIIRYNEVWGGNSSVGTGIDTSGDASAGRSIEVWVIGNIVRDSVGYGFSASGDEGQQDSVYYANNLTYNVLKGFFAYECVNVSYYSNTVGDVNVTNSGHSPFYLTGGTPCATQKVNATLRNNIITCGTSAICNQIIRISSTQTVLDSDYNLFFRNAIGDASVGNIDGTTKTFAQWKTATSQDAHSVEGNPKLNILYVPLSSSPAVSAGVDADLGVYTNSDIRGLARPNGTTDIGAYEYWNGMRIQ